ncbi:dihydrodipicolinate synthase [Rubellimicrobium thermophilum DSM 16684]|uniref:4-hydroxy-tetrahydrodipicolinate synthase n=1 Tax=Rubellimicrobium thermophilum DSM 16684 TaxID=1123069 RepID=S9QZ39_9RHOB|nr:dihydrodipicolinate synthase [Rubellimicrobium thermophilum DSM 16684]
MDPLPGPGQGLAEIGDHGFGGGSLADRRLAIGAQPVEPRPVGMRGDEGSVFGEFGRPFGFAQMAPFDQVRDQIAALLRLVARGLPEALIGQPRGLAQDLDGGNGFRPDRPTRQGDDEEESRKAADDGSGQGHAGPPDWGNRERAEGFGIKAYAWGSRGQATTCSNLAVGGKPSRVPALAASGPQRTRPSGRVPQGPADPLGMRTGTMFQGSITALVTPFRDGGLDLEALKALVDWQIAEGSHGLVPVGTTGESPTLSHEEHDLVVATVVRQAAGRVPVIAGAGSNSTAECVRLVQAAKAAGADAALVVTPYYNRPTQAGLIAHFTAAAEVGLPIIIYNIPGRSAVDMTPATMGELARHPMIVGVKDATGDLSRVPKQRITCGTDFIQLSGEDATALGFNAQWGAGLHLGDGECRPPPLRGIPGGNPCGGLGQGAGLSGPADAPARGDLPRTRSVRGEICPVAAWSLPRGGAPAAPARDRADPGGNPRRNGACRPAVMALRTARER